MRRKKNKKIWDFGTLLLKKDKNNKGKN